MLRSTAIIAAIVGLAGVASANGVLLRWLPSPDVGGYRVYIGEESRHYTESRDVGLLSADIVDGVVYYLATDLPPGRSYYFALTAYSEAGESDYSNEKIVFVDAEHGPRADAGGDRGGALGQTFVVGGTPDPALHYLWRQDSGPSVVLGDRTGGQLALTPTAPGVFELTLIAYDDAGLASSDAVRLVVSAAAPSPSASPRRLEPSATPRPTASATAVPSDTATVTPSPSGTATATPSLSETPTATPSRSGTATTTPTARDTATATPTASDTASITPTPSGTTTATPSPPETASSTPSAPDTSTFTPSSTPSPTPTPTDTPEPLATAVGVRPSATPTASATPTEGVRATLSATPSPTATPPAAAQNVGLPAAAGGGGGCAVGDENAQPWFLVVLLLYGLLRKCVVRTGGRAGPTSRSHASALHREPWSGLCGLAQRRGSPG